VNRRPRRPQRRESSELPPHSLEAEQGVLGCCLAHPDNIESVQERVKSYDGVFYDLRHQEIWNSMLALRTLGKPVDVITLTQALRDSGQLEACGGVAFVSGLIDQVPSPANWSYYLDIVVERLLLRRVLAQCATTMERVKNGTEEASALVAQYQKEAVALVDQHTVNVVVPQRERVHRLVDLLERRHRGKQAITGLETPFWYLNNMTAGLQGGELVVIGARPSTGKTALGCDLTRHAAILGKSVAFYSVEMSGDQIELRMFAAQARVNGMKLRNGFWKEEHEPRFPETAEVMQRWKLHLDDRSTLTGQDVLLGARRLKREVGLDLVVVDYIQIMRGVGKYDQRHEELGEVSRFLKQTAKELNIPVVALAQLSRDSEKDRGGRRPLLSDLKDSGSIEQDADVVGLLWEPKINEDDEEDMAWLEHHTPDDPKEDETEWKQWFRRINLSIAKNRNGATGECELVFQKSTARFVDAHSPKRVKEQLL
jgi:replicative DNA helicase